MLRIALHGLLHRSEEAIGGGNRRRGDFGVPSAQAERFALVVYFLSGILGALMSVCGKLATQAGAHFMLLTLFRSVVLTLLTVPVLVRQRINPFAITET